MKYIKNSKGYTLVELLAVILVIVAVGSIITGIIVSSLRGSNKTNAINNIRQGANSPVAQIAKMVEYAQGFDGVSANGVNYSNCYFPPVPSPTPTPDMNFNYLKITTFEGGEALFSCTGNPLTIASNGASLVDTSSIVVKSCYFTCSRQYLNEPPTIGIHLELVKPASSFFEREYGPVSFDTSVVMRNVNQ